MAGGRRRGEAEALIRLLGEDKITELIERAQAGVFGIGEATKEASQETDGLLDGWKGSVVVFNQGLELVGKIGDGVKATFDIIKDAAAADAVNKAFADQFQGAEAAVEKLRKAVAGALSDQELKRVATQFQRAGLGIDKTSQVLNVAARISATTGQALSEVTEELQDAIIGASDSNLEKFGIIADLPELAQRYAKEQGIAKDEIDKSVESAAILDEILGNVSDKFADADLTNLTTQVGQLEAQWKNLNDEAAQFFKVIAVGVAQDVGLISDGADSLEGRVRALTEEMRAAGITVEQLADAQKALNAQFSIANQQQINEMTPQLRALATQFGELLPEVKNNDLAMRQLNEQLKVMAQENLGSVSLAMMDSEEATKLLHNEMTFLGQEMGVASEVASQLNRELRAQEEAQYRAAIASAEASRDKERAAEISKLMAAARREEVAAEIKYNKELRKNEEAQKRAAARTRARGGGRGRRGRRGAAEIGAGLFSRGVAGPAGLGLAEGFAGDGLIFDVQGFTGPPDPQDFMQAGPPDAMIEQILKARDAVNGLSDSFAALGMTFEHTLIEGMRQSTNILAAEVDRISSIFKQTEAAGDSTGKALAASVPGAVKAGGDIAKALGASMVVTETLYGIADVAQAATRFAFGDVKAGAMFTVSAGLHFAAAAQAGAKGGGGRGGGGARTVPRAPAAAIGQPAAGGGGGPMQITQVFSGVMIGPGGVRESARAVKQLTEQEATRGARSADFIPAG
jgi:hypothetical protein